MSKYMNKYYWGTPLEQLACNMLHMIYFQNEDSAYKYAKQLYHAFMRVNPDFWNKQ